MFLVTALQMIDAKYRCHHTVFLCLVINDS